MGPNCRRIIGGIYWFCRWEKLRPKRLKYLAELLEKKEIDIDDNLIKNEDFLHAIILIVNSVLKTSKEKRIGWFADLLENGIKSELIINDSESFEYFESLLDSVSYSEMLIIEAINEIKDQLQISADGIDNSKELIQIALTNIKKYVNYNEDLILGILDKLTYSGLVEKVAIQAFVFGAVEASYYYRQSSLYFDLRGRRKVELKVT